MIPVKLQPNILIAYQSNFQVPIQATHILTLQVDIQQVLPSPYQLTKNQGKLRLKVSPERDTRGTGKSTKYLMFLLGVFSGWFRLGCRYLLEQLVHIFLIWSATPGIVLLNVFKPRLNEVNCVTKGREWICYCIFEKSSSTSTNEWL